MATFERLDVWKRSSRLCVDIYKALHSCNDFGFKDQATRSALSIPSNIAEGSERESDKEFARFLKIAKGSCGELRTQLYIGAELGYLHKERAEAFIEETIALSKMLRGLIKRC